jgi:muramidase (phage lysozyme)
MAIIIPEEAGSIALCHFLDLIGFSEGTATSRATKNDGYDVVVSGPDGPETFTDYTYHPFAHRAAKLVQHPSPEHPAGIFSTASGRYQLLYHYWLDYATMLGLKDFSPLSQDRVALQQIKERPGAIAAIEEGYIATAIKLCSNIWASFPGNDYGQGGHAVGSLLTQWGRIAGNPATPETVTA